MFGLAFAMGSPAGGAAGGGLGAIQQFIPLIFMIAIFYFLLIRPQQKKAKEHKLMLDAIKKGDNVMTAGGVYGKISSVEDTMFGLEIANGVVIKISKPFVASKVTK